MEKTGLLAKESLEILGYHVLAISAALYVVFVMYLLAAPFLVTSNNQTLVDLGAVPYIFSALSFLCHQIPERSFQIFGAPFPVCARDVGIYVGSVAGLVIPLFFRRTRESLYSIKLFLLAFVPIGLDVVSQSVFAVRESSNVLRLATGLFFGFGFFAYVTSRILLKNTLLEKTVTSREGLATTVVATLFFTYVLYTGFVEDLRLDYVSAGKAKEIALEETGLSGRPTAYFIPPKSPVSIHADRFAEAYDDYVIKDLRGMNWTVEEYAQALSLNLSYRKPLSERHLLGLWAVVIPAGRWENRGKFVYSNVPGRYVYLDALSGEIIEEKTHN